MSKAAGMSFGLFWGGLGSADATGRRSFALFSGRFDSAADGAISVTAQAIPISSFAGCAPICRRLHVT